jgi:hypothetical protein
MLFLSQPVGVGFSYGGKEEGSIDSFTGSFVPASVGGVDGRWPTIDPTAIDTTNLAAMAAWEVLQGFYSALPQLDSRVESTTFNLFTESYGGHYGPAFFNYFYEQNAMIANGTSTGKYMDFNSLGIVSVSLACCLCVSQSSSCIPCTQDSRSRRPFRKTAIETKIAQLRPATKREPKTNNEGAGVLLKHYKSELHHDKN